MGQVSGLNAKDEEVVLRSTVKIKCAQIQVTAAGINRIAAWVLF
jgi:hypothetical protein